LSPDTSPEVARLVAERFRAMSGRERFMIGVQMFESARALALASLRPDASHNELRRHLCARFYPELSKAYAATLHQAVVIDNPIVEDLDG